MARGQNLGGRRMFFYESDIVATPDSSTTLACTAVLQTNLTDAIDVYRRGFTVPMTGAELVWAEFYVVSPGTVTTAGTQQWSISDGTNAMMTMAATNATTAANTSISLTVSTKLTEAAEGTAFIITNTETGTIGDGMHGYFRTLWAY